MSSQPTPMMAQYLEIKSKYPDALLFYRMGDFYELFFQDAVDAAAILDITLTQRGKHEGADIPMCGVPVHSHESYLHKLIKTGRHVAICEQLEDPAEAKKRGSKSVVKRDVVRLVTPGTITEDNLLDHRAHNYLAAYVRIHEEEALAWADISTGEFFVATIHDDLAARLAALEPNELIVPDGMDALGLEALIASLSPISKSSFDVASSENRLQKLYKVQSLDAFAPFSRAEISAMGGIVDYLSITQIEAHLQLRPPIHVASSSYLQIDAATRRNLELTASLSGGKAGSLLDAIDGTLTAIGARRFEERLRLPIQEISELNARLDRLDALKPANWEELRLILREIPDFERAYTRLQVGRGNARDMRALGDGIVHAAKLAEHLPKNAAINSIQIDLVALEDIGMVLIELLEESPPAFLRDGGFIRAGQFDELDELRALRDDTKTIIAQKQSDYISLSKVQALKIKFNNVLGYFIEVPATHSNHMLSDDMSAHFIHRQTTANALRFTTPELSEMQTRILGATEEAIAFEKRIFEEWAERLRDHGVAIAALADAVGEIDTAYCMSRLAEDGWTRPEMKEDTTFEIKGGRHPVVENALKAAGEDFMANHCALNDEPGRLWLITGPNMAGKSTFLRQNALIAILAQCGFYVPAQSATIGIVDKIFSRIGAADDLARGRSTFMVEMIETAAILNQSTKRSLVILDEIGRGTSTYDGLAIAWATLEYLLSQIDCRGLFATHFHELTALEERYPNMHTAHIAIREWEDQVIFLHEVKAGNAKRSYGIDVAKLAGLPDAVINRAKEILGTLEEDNHADITHELPLFQADIPREQTKPSPAIEALQDANPDFMTPKEALELLYELKSKL